MWRFDVQDADNVIDAFSDANWAGCRQFSYSTSGGALLIGIRPITIRSKTLAAIAKSSAESELYGIVRTTCESLGFMTLMADMGADMRVQLHMDAITARGIVDCEGVSKLRHLDVNVFWLQEQLAREQVPRLKAHGHENGADSMTKHLSVEIIRRHIERMSLEYRGSRTNKAVALQSVNIIIVNQDVRG